MTMISLEIFVIILSIVICRFECQEIIQHPTSQNVSEGDNVTFTCRFNSSFEEHGYRRLWYGKFKGKASPTGITINHNVRQIFQDRFTVSEDEVLNYELNIAPVLYNDAGIYYCEVDNDTIKIVISRSNEVQLEVNTPPADPLCYIQHVINNTQYVCTSNIKGDNVYWMYENKIILQQIIEVVENYAQTLRCYINNSLGIPNRTCVINNHCVVQHEIDGPMVIGDNAAFTCNCRYRHLWNVTSWTYNGTKISSSKERFLVSDKSLFINGIQEKDNGLLIQCNANEVSSGLLKLQTVSKTTPIKTRNSNQVSPTPTSSKVYSNTTSPGQVSPTNDSMSFLKYIAFVLTILLCVITVGGIGYCCIRCRKKNKPVISNHSPMAPNNTQLPMTTTPIHFAHNKYEIDSNTYKNSDIKRNLSNDSEGLPEYASTIEVANVVYDYHPPMAPDSTQMPKITPPIHSSQNNYESVPNTYKNSDIKRNTFKDSKVLKVYAETMELTDVEDVVYDNLTADTATGDISFEDDDWDDYG